MSKFRNVQTIEQNGVRYGQQSHPDDLMKAQSFAHTHTELLTKDFLLRGNTSAEVIGFEYSIREGNSLTIEIAKGRIYSADGTQFEMDAAQTVTIEQADSLLPRLDAVCARFEADVPAEFALVPFTRLRNAQELAAAVPPYAPQQFNQPLEIHNEVTIVVKTGNASLNFQPPVLAANEIPLYFVTVPGGAVGLQKSDITDLRDEILSLRRAATETAQNRNDIAVLRKRLSEIDRLDTRTVTLGGEIRGIGELLSQLSLQLDALRNNVLPDVDNPNYAPTDWRRGIINAVTGSENGTSVVDVEIGVPVKFGDKLVALRPEMFPKTLNARFALAQPSAATQTVQTLLTTNNVTIVAADGNTDFSVRNAAFGAKRSRAATAARDGRFIEVFGGLAGDNATMLGDWLTYDSANDTLTPRHFSGANPPNADRPLLISVGDRRSEMILACGRSDTTAARWFKFNTDTGVCAELSGAKPTGVAFFGDLVTADYIFIVALQPNDAPPKFWSLDPSDGTFTQLSTSGSIPSCPLDWSAGCFYEQNRFCVVEFTPNQSASGRTYIFDISSQTWTKLSIPQPFKNPSAMTARQMPISRFRMANVNGKVVIVGGNMASVNDPARAVVWEMISVYKSTSEFDISWKSVEVTTAPVQDAAFCSLLTDLPNGKGFTFAGTNQFNDAVGTICAAVRAGLAVTNYDGQPAITVADSSTFVQFIVPNLPLNWDIAGYFLSIKGRYDNNNLSVEISFDNGVTWRKVSLDAAEDIDLSGNQMQRILRITLRNQLTKRPILQQLTEIFDQDASRLDRRQVIRYNRPDEDYALYLHRDGSLKIVDASTGIVAANLKPSRPSEAILHKVIGGVLKNFVNRKRPKIRLKRTAATFDNPLAVAPNFVSVVGVDKSSNALYEAQASDVGFDTVINISQVISGDSYIIELEG